jgi:hypothetical protein
VTTGPDLDLRRSLLIASAAIGVAWGVLIVAWGEAPFALTFDDAYYYFGIARNLAEGNGPTFDGINPTNGYHPFWLVAAVPVYWLGLDDLTSVRVLLLVQLAAYVGALVVIARVVSSLVGYWPRIRRTNRDDHDVAVRLARSGTLLAFVTLGASPFMLRLFVNGLESGLAVLVWVVVLGRFALSSGPLLTAGTSRWRATTGVLLLVAFLVRTDAALAVGCLGLWLLVELWNRSDRRGHLSSLAEYLAPTVLGGIGFVAFNLWVFGTPLQVSGLIKRAPIDGRAVLVMGASVALAVIAGRRSFRRGHTDGAARGRMRLSADLMGRIGWFGAFCLLLLGYYTGLQTQQWLWYYAPIGVLGLLVLPLVLADLSASAVVESRTTQSIRAAVLPVQAILLVPLLGFAAFQARSFADPQVRSIQVANRDAGVWIDENLPDDAVLASWDAGVVGYFSNRSIVNVDGVVNSHDYYEAMSAGQVGPFLDDDGVEWIVNHGSPTDGQDVEILDAIERWWSPEVAAEARLQETWPFTFSGVTMGSGGTDSSGPREMAVFLYELPPVADR